MLRAYLLDDERLALERLQRLLVADGRVDVVGSSTDPVAAVSEIETRNPDLLFLDIQMPELDGFGVLERLPRPPLVVFATAFDQYALRAFETNSVAYLLKPIAPAKLAEAIDKIQRVRGGQDAIPDLQALFSRLKSTLQSAPENRYPTRISSRSGDRVEFVDLTRVTHFYAEDKLTFASTERKDFVVDSTITELSERLDPRRFVRVHRGSLVNVDYVTELYSYFAGKWILRLRDVKKTEIPVAKDRVKDLREILGF